MYLCSTWNMGYYKYLNLNIYVNFVLSYVFYYAKIKFWYVFYYTMYTTHYINLLLVN